MFLNIRERKQEIGILMAIGLPLKKIFSIFFFKVIFISLLGSVLGYFFGSLIALYFGPDLVHVPVNLILSALITTT